MIKRTSLDAVFSDLIRESYDWVCCRCGLEFPDRKGRGAHVSHFFSRRYTSTRWFVDNCFLLCAACHDYVGKDPDEHVRFVRRILGEVRYEWLCQRKHQIVRYRSSDKAEIRKHYAGELSRVKALRASGVMGPVEIVGWDA